MLSGKSVPSMAAVRRHSNPCRGHQGVRESSKDAAQKALSLEVRSEVMACYEPPQPLLFPMPAGTEEAALPNWVRIGSSVACSPNGCKSTARLGLSTLMPASEEVAYLSITEPASASRPGSIA